MRYEYQSVSCQSGFDQLVIYAPVKQPLRKSFAGLGLALFAGVAWRIVIELQEEILA